MTVAPKKREQNGFVTPLQVESVDPFTWRLLGDLVWVGSANPPDVITVPAGSVTDFATVPQVFQSFIPRTGAWTKAAVVHDHLCDRLCEWKEDEPLVEQGVIGSHFFQPPTFNAVETDAVFEKIMIEDGVPRWKAAIMWTAVRWAALANPARRGDWWSTFDRVALLTVFWLLVVGLIATGCYLLVDFAIEALL
jgi:hypothetical protein